MAYAVKFPGKSFLGKGALEAAKPEICKLGKKAFIVTGKHITAEGLTGQLADRLTQWGIQSEIYTGIVGEPTERMITEGVDSFRKTGCDFVIGIGGGSPLDSAKAIAAMTVLDGKISDYMGREIRGDFPGVVLIPTTAGTGSEATRFTIITDEENDVKMLLAGDDLLPAVAVVDAEFTLSSPKSVTAATGMDALTHAVETYTSRKGNPVTDLLALSAIEKIFKNLPAAWRDSSNLQAREQLAEAAYEAGICINNASVTLVHGMSRPIGALFHVPHGISNAMLIVECLNFAKAGCPERFATLAYRIGAAAPESSTDEAAGSFLQALEKLCGEIEIPTLAQYGIDREKFLALVDKMAEDALASGSPANTIREVTKEDILGIYHRLWNPEK